MYVVDENNVVFQKTVAVEVNGKLVIDKRL
jgi:hypothetical protein